MTDVDVYFVASSCVPEQRDSNWQAILSIVCAVPSNEAVSQQVE
jgi:hypothetical protein